MDTATRQRFQTELDEIEAAGLTKVEREIESAQGAVITVGGRPVLNFCANNYLGLAGSEGLVRAAHAALDRWGYGLSSVRFICGTQQIHRDLEHAISAFLGTEDTILYSSCFDAATGLFETLLGPEDAIISDELNHACIILDEGQNASVAQMKMFLTRMGHASKIVVTGDLTQTDLPRTVRSGLADAVHRLRDVDGLSIVYLDQGDIVRNPIVTRIVKAYEEDGPRSRKSPG